MKLLQQVKVISGAYKECKGIVTDITESGKIYVTLQYRVKNKLKGYIRVSLNTQDLELL